MLLTRFLRPRFLLPAWTSRCVPFIQHRTITVKHVSGSGPFIRRMVYPPHASPTAPSISSEHTSDVIATEAKEATTSTSKSPLAQLGESFPSLKSVATKAQRSPPRLKKARTSKAEGAPRTLLEELFPEDIQASTKSETVSDLGTQGLGDADNFKWAQSNRRQFPDPDSFLVDSDQSSADSGSKSVNIQRVDGVEIRQRKNATVLVLSNASKSLSESDFLRLSPKGKHIEGWTSGIIKVIPGRDPQTLEPLGHYFILFSTDAAARAYQDQITRLHHLSRTYTARSITSPLPPPPGYLKDGEDIHALMQSFTLIPSSQKNVSIRMLSKPFGRSVQSIVINGGYLALAAHQRICEDLVLFSVEGGNVSLYDLKGIIGSDGKDRNHHWGLFGSDRDIIKLDSSMESEANSEQGEQLDSASATSLGVKKKRRQVPRFVISFKDQLEARRFVRAWHRRPFPERGERPLDDDLAPLVSAELLW